ncbi:hypothetical protein IWW37_004555 [Coemansia sp. RSA 2050]|nr:hypothetical protein IWW37_004555 [Coemansia sp. RSA 2050]
MVCVLCFRLFSEGLPNDDNDDSSSGSESTNASTIAALSCGHIFHLVCITLWQNRETNTVCPRCNSSHLGLVLVLHTETDELDLHGDAEEVVSHLSYGTLLNSAKQHASHWQELQKENELLKLVINMKDSRLHEKQTTISDLYKQLAALEYKVKELGGGAKESEVEGEYYFDGIYTIIYMD